MCGCFFSDVLMYYSEAFLPFLRNFFDEFYQISEPHEDITKNIYTSLLVGKGHKTTDIFM